MPSISVLKTDESPPARLERRATSLRPFEALSNMVVAALAKLAGFTSFWRRPASAAGLSNTRFYGSQIGSKSVINYTYTDLPWRLIAWDIYYFFKFVWAVPYILLPVTPSDSAELDELSVTPGNMFSLFIQVMLGVLQFVFILGSPALVLLPVWTSAMVVGLFLLVNQALCRLVNGKGIEYHSDPEYAPALPVHAHEQWLFINGVCTGEHWMKANVNRLAVTFKRPVLGFHNKTAGFLFDIIECLVQRNLGYATTDVRVCYKSLKEKLYNPQYSKVVLILHSQGAIEGSMIIDWLLQELPQDLLAKLEVYTFAAAANHFNNPHRHIASHKRALRNPLAASTDSTNLASLRGSQSLSNGKHRRSVADGARHENNDIHVDTSQWSDIPSLTSETSSAQPSALSDRAIGHIEHYAHATDFVALWGVLHFATTTRLSHSMPRFIGRLFARTCARGGHLLNQHYLDGMFPLQRDAKTGELARDERGIPVGCAEEGNEFMESEIALGEEGDEMQNARDAMEHTWLGDGETEGKEGVEVHSLSPTTARGRNGHKDGVDGLGDQVKKQGQKVKVKDLSRLWQYRNGRTPDELSGLLARGTTF